MFTFKCKNNRTVTQLKKSYLIDHMSFVYELNMNQISSSKSEVIVPLFLEALVQKYNAEIYVFPCKEG